MTTEKTIALTRWIFFGKVMSLLFNMLFSFSSKEQVSFNFMAVVTICSDFVVELTSLEFCFEFCIYAHEVYCFLVSFDFGAKIICLTE